ncbi:MAG TPA: cytochrome c biogenesis protein CcdA [Elusimicrobiota bacterium]|nr:cytochrome c biogenesis protein CcdA [Elusimicrobiota bacterium]
MGHIGLGAAFIAGVASFLSPCVLPLIPGYLSLMSGLSLEDLAKDSSRGQVAAKAGLGSLFFVLGFSLVFTLLGASASSVGSFLVSSLPALDKVAGVLIMLFGLHIMGVLPIKWLYYERRFSSRGISPGYAGSFLMGLAFAFGWTPCIGPILGAILALAATQKTAAQGMALLCVYSLGLGVPFIASAFGMNIFLQFFARYKRYIRWGEVLAGAFLVFMGALVFSRHLGLISRYLPQSFFRFAL